MPPEQPAEQNPTENDSSVLQYGTPLQRERMRILQEVKRELDQVSGHSECQSCRRPSDRLLRVSVRNSEFQCVVPVPVCSSCAEQPPFVLASIDLRWRLAVVAIAVAIVLAVASLWLLSAIAGAIAFGLAIFVPEPKRMSVQDRQIALGNFLGAIPHLRAMRTLEPDLVLTVSEKDPTVSLQDMAPAVLFENSLRFFEQVQFWISASELTRSEIHPQLLGLMIDRILTLIKQALSDSELNDETSIQVDFAVLPERTSKFELQAITDNSAPLTKTLIPELKNLPTVAVRWPVIFSCRRCKENGTHNLNRVSEPFQSWRGKPEWVAGGTYSEIAMRIFAVTPGDEFRAISADDITAWRKLGELPDSIVVDFADVLLSDDKRAEAAEVLETQILVSPDNALLKFRLALVLYQLDQVERAASICQQLVQWFPQFAEAYAFLAHLQLDMERPKDAEKTLSSAPRENRTARFWLTFARVAQALDDIDVAHSYINTAILLDYDYAEAYLVRAGLFQRQEKYAAALEDLTTIENRGYLSFQLISMKVNLLNQLHQADQAIAAITNALQKLPEHPVLLLMRADALTNAGKFELAKEDCDALLARSPNFSMALEMRARIHLEEENALAALADADQAIANGHDSSQIYVYRGVSKMLLQEFVQAEEDLEVACEKNPDNVIAKFHLSRAKAALGQSEGAIAALDQALTLAEDWAYARMIRGYLHLNQGDLDLATADFDRAIQQSPSLVHAYRGRSIVHRLKGENREALAMLDKALLLDPDDTDCRMDRSQILLTEDDLKRATKDLDSVLSSLPDLLPALLSRAQLKLQLGKIDDAQKDFDAILKSHPDFAPALIGRSVILDQLGEHERSQKDLEAATRGQPEKAQDIEVSRLLMKAILARKQEQYEAAVQATTEVIEIDPENYMAYRIRAGSYWYSDCFVEALQDYTHLINTQEEPDAASFNGRGQVYAELGEYELALLDMETAVRLARDKKDPALPYCLSGLGKTLTGLHRFDEAEAAFRESLSIQPDNGWLHFNRGLLYLAKNDPQSAGLCFELALRLDNPRLSPRKRLKAEGFVAALGGKSSGNMAGDQ